MARGLGYPRASPMSENPTARQRPAGTAESSAPEAAPDRELSPDRTVTVPVPVPQSGPGSGPVRLELHGRPLGRYIVLEALGAGGMGVVYSAYDPELNRKVAIKL